MRRLLGALLAALVLVGALAACGDDSGPVTDDPVTDDPAPTAAPSPTDGTDEGAVDFEVVDIITVTGAGGQLDAGAPAVPLGDDAAVQQFDAQFNSEQLTTEIQEAVAGAAVTEDMRLYGAVVAIGCDEPGQLFVTASGQGPIITAGEVPSPRPECYAAMTTVALVLVPASSLG
jgi:predicted small lipoprotein YifL